MKTQIIGVLGLGIFGQTLATELSSFGQDVIALDNNSTTIDFLADQVTKAAVGDITDIDFLRSAGIDTCDTVVIATGEHLESSALALLHCKKLGITNIIAKVKKTYLHDEEGKKELNALIAGMGLEEKEYWNFMRPQYKTNLVISKYLKKCYEQRCKDEGINMTSSEFQEKKMKWRSDIVQDAVEKYKVKVQ